MLAGLIGLVGEWIPKSALARLLKLVEWWPALLATVVPEADEVDSFRVAVVVDGDLAMGRDIPRSFPRLATPTPQVRVVR